MPTWGLAFFHDVSRAPCAASVSSTVSHSASPMRVVSFAVRVRARAAPRRTGYCSRVERAAAPERIYRPVALVHIAAALEYDRTEAVPGERSAANSPAGPRPTTTGRCARRFAVRNGRPCIFFFNAQTVSAVFPQMPSRREGASRRTEYTRRSAAARVDADAAHRSLGLRRQQSGQTAGPVERRRLRLVKRQPDAGHKQAHSLSLPVLAGPVRGTAVRSARAVPCDLNFHLDVLFHERHVARQTDGRRDAL